MQDYKKKIEKQISSTILSSSGPGYLHVNSKILNLKVYIKYLRVLDLKLVTIIATSPTQKGGVRRS